MLWLNKKKDQNYSSNVKSYLFPLLIQFAIFSQLATLRIGYEYVFSFVVLLQKKMNNKKIH